MPRFTLDGFPSGNSVSLTATQAALTESASVSNWGGTTGSVSIDAQMPPSGGLAPQGVWFEATDLSGFTLSDGSGLEYEPELHELTYVWTFGDPGTFDVPGNMPPQWRDRNKAYGARVAHTFRQPGTYTVSLWVMDRNGVTATAETTLEVGDPETSFPGTRTICFSNTPDFSEAPAGCQQVTSMAELHAAILALPLTGGIETSYRLLFKRGEVVDEVFIPINGKGLLGTAPYSNIVFVGAFGTGEKPVLNGTRDEPIIDFGRFGVVKEKFHLTGVRLEGGWDPTSETGVITAASVDFRAHTEPGMVYTVHDVEISGFAVTDVSPCIGGVNDPVDGTSIWDSVHITNWRVFGIYARTTPDHIRTRLAFTGCRVTQNVDALNGGPKNGLHNEHGCLRTEAVSDLFVSGCDFFTRCGWSALAGRLADNAALRPNTSGRAGAYINMERMVVEGGYEVLNLKENAAGTPDSPINAIIDRAILVGTSKTLLHVSCDAGGSTLRNVYCYQPNVKNFHPNPFGASMKFTLGGGPTPDNFENPIALHAVTAVNMRTTANSPGQSENWRLQDGIDVYEIYTIENDIVHAPNLDVPIDPYAPIDLSEAIPGVTTRYKGVRHNFDGQTVSLATEVNPGESFTIPYTDITELLADGSGEANPTDQIYWLEALAENSGHFMLANGFYYAERGEFSVSAETSGLRVTNTSATTWTDGTVKIRINRLSKLPPMNPVTDSSGQTIPLPRPMPGSQAIDTEAQGWAPDKDLLLEDRAEPPARGAFRQL